MKDEEIHVLPRLTAEQVQNRKSLNRETEMHRLSETALRAVWEKLKDGKTGTETSEAGDDG